ncbi:proline iminopeptidase-family hydrolase [Sphingomonas sp. UNC305MFCol5.2]|uniref:proline iminopeptidase-family hydrolase n=1 Tax=Sphingomonas sp. UNC305MFCol5.2 TaxID=1449076 RepID=UPI00041F9035|nr:proline iminopeptidase-family hydrolase [Sphingomonas sp. UNC305MFCol5.2]
MSSTSPWTRRTAIKAGAALLAGVAGGGMSLPAIPETDGYCPVPGGKVYWRRFGSGKRTPLLILHGGPGAAHNYMLSLKALADDRPVIFYDQLGCGKAESPTDETLYTIQRSVDELDAVRRALRLPEIILVGHSWGTFLAIEYMCQGRGVGVEKLVLSGASASTAQVIAGQQRLIDSLPNGFAAKLHGLEKAGRMDSPEYAALTQQFYDNFVLRVPPTPDAQASFEALAKSIAYRVMNGPNEFYITGIIKDWDRHRDLNVITQPVLLTTGEFDEITMDCHTTIRAGVSGLCRLEVMARCSHLTMVEKPDEYNALVRGFANAA